MYEDKKKTKYLSMQAPDPCRKKQKERKHATLVWVWIQDVLSRQATKQPSKRTATTKKRE